MKFLFNFKGAEQTENVVVAEESLTDQELAQVTGGCGDRGDRRYDDDDCGFDGEGRRHRRSRRNRHHGCGGDY